jgi:hypothetical protein
VAAYFHSFLLQEGADNVVQEIVSDNGSQFVGADFEAIRHCYPHVRHHRIPVGSPKHGGFYEIRHRDAKAVISKELISRPLTDWVELAALAERKVNSNRDESGYPSPFAMMRGFEPPSKIDRVQDLLFDRADQESAPRLKPRAQRLVQELRARLDNFERLCEDQFRQSRLDVNLKRELSRRPELVVGEKVLVRARRSVKHDPKWHPRHGSLTIKEVHNTLVVVVDEDGDEKTYALRDVKRDPGSMTDELAETESEFDEFNEQDDLSELGDDVEDTATTDSDCSVSDKDTAEPSSSKRSRKPSAKQQQLIDEAKANAKRRKLEKLKKAKKGDAYDACCARLDII